MSSESLALGEGAHAGHETDAEPPGGSDRTASASPHWPLKRRSTAWAVVLLAILALTVWLMRNWLGVLVLGTGVPSSHRREMYTELTLAWLFKQELASGRLLSEWSPIWFSGFPWLRFLSF